MARSKRRAKSLENRTAAGEDASSWGTDQAQRLVYDGVMHVTDAKSTVATGIATGRQISKTLVDWPPEVPRVVCCGLSIKGPARPKDLSAKGGRAQPGEQTARAALFPRRADRLADQELGIRAFSRAELLHSPVFDFCDIQVAFLVDAHSVYTP